MLCPVYLARLVLGLDEHHADLLALELHRRRYEGVLWLALAHRAAALHVDTLDTQRARRDQLGKDSAKARDSNTPKAR